MRPVTGRTILTVAVVLLAASTVAVGGGTAPVRPADSNPAVQETETTEAANETTTAEGDGQDLAEGTSQFELVVENLSVTNLTLRNVTILNATVQEAIVPNATLRNASADRVVVTATMQNVTLENVVFRNETVANRLGLTGNRTSLTLEETDLTNTTINGLLIDTGEIAETVEVNVTTTEDAAQVEPAGQPAVEIGNATVGSANVQNLMLVNFQTGDGTATETTVAEMGEEGAETETPTETEAMATETATETESDGGVDY